MFQKNNAVLKIDLAIYQILNRLADVTLSIQTCYAPAHFSFSHNHLPGTQFALLILLLLGFATVIL